MSLPALPVTADTRTITERVNVLIRDYNNPPAPPAPTPPQRLVPPGTVLPFAGSAAPTGFLLCYGQAVSRADHADLFAAIGTTYGAGNGSTTFNLPDLRGRVAAGIDNMGGAGANRITAAGSGIAGTTLGATGGAQTHTLTVAQMPSHGHGVSDPGHIHGTRGAHNTTGFENAATLLANGSAASFPTYGSVTGISIQANGSSQPHQNVQPTIVLNYIIAT